MNITVKLISFLGLLTGIVKVSAEGRLKMSFGIDECNVDIATTENVDSVKEKIKKLIEMAATAEGLVNMRVKLDQSDLFDTFVNFCLVHFTTSLNWRYKSYNTNISDIFSDSDEGLCMLILENNAQDFLKVYSTGNALSRKESMTKYTKSKGGVNAKFKGWNRKGIKRFNQLIQSMKKNRTTVHSQALEETLKDKYEGIFREHSKNEAIDNDDEDDNSSDEDVDAYDGFEGEAHESESVENIVLSQSVNITGV